MNLSKPLSLPGLSFHFQVNMFNKMLAQVSFHDKVDLAALPAALRLWRLRGLPIDQLMLLPMAERLGGGEQSLKSIEPIIFPNFSHLKG